MLPSALWITVSPESTSCMAPAGTTRAPWLGTAGVLTVPPCSDLLLVVTTPRSLAESYAADEDSRTTFQVPEPVVVPDVFSV